MLASLPDHAKARQLVNLYYKHAAWMYVMSQNPTPHSTLPFHRTLLAKPIMFVAGTPRSPQPNLRNASSRACTTNGWTLTPRRWTRTGSPSCASCSGSVHCSISTSHRSPPKRCDTTSWAGQPSAWTPSWSRNQSRQSKPWCVHLLAPDAHLYQPGQQLPPQASSRCRALRTDVHGSLLIARE